MSGVFKSVICNGCTLCIMAYIYIYISMCLFCVICVMLLALIIVISTFYVVGLTAL